jgi:hypothetical protein
LDLPPGRFIRAAVLDGLTGGLPLPICGGIGGLCAAEIISYFGARPERNPAEPIAERGSAHPL